MSFLDKAQPIEKLRTSGAGSSFLSKAQPVERQPEKAPGIFNIGTLKGETSFPSDVGARGVTGNIARTFGNIPSSVFGLARGIVSPINPLDVDAPLNIGGSIAKSGQALGDIFKTRGAIEGTKDIVKGVGSTLADLFKRPGEFIVKKGLEAFEDPAKFGGDLARGLSKKVIEDPLLIPSLLVGGGSTKGKDLISKTATPVLKGAEVTGKVIEKTVQATKKIIAKSQKSLENSIVVKFEKGVKPLLPSKTTPKLLSKYRREVVGGTKVINENKNILKFTDDAGDIIKGKNPESLQQFAESIDQTKKVIFKGYDDLAKKAGVSGDVIDLTQTASHLDEVISSKSFSISSPQTVQYAQQVKERLGVIGKIDTITTQDVIQQFNERLKAFYRNPTPTEATNVAIDALIANNLRKQADEFITSLTGTSYKELRGQYTSLKAIERDVIKASLRDARKNIKGLIDYTDIFSSGDLITGIATMNPTAIARGTVMRGIKEFYKHLNDPNRIIKTMFKDVERVSQIPKSQSSKARGLGNIRLQTQPATDIKTIPKIKAISKTLQQTSTKSKAGTLVSELLAKEARKFDNPTDFRNLISNEVRDKFRELGIRSEEQFTKFWNNNVIAKEPILSSLNPTGSVFVDYTPKTRATIKLGKNITTLDKTSKKAPDTVIIIYRGAPKTQKSIVPGDFITTNRELAKSYTGDGNVLSKKVKMSEVLDDLDSPLGEEYLYRPQISKTGTLLRKLETPKQSVKKVIKDNFASLREKLLEGEMLVKDKKGNIGAIDIDDFDATIHEKL